MTARCFGHDTEGAVAHVCTRLCSDNACCLPVRLTPVDPGFVAYANGVTYVEYCVARDCYYDADEMVGPESLCGAHARQRRAERVANRAHADAWAASPEGRAAARAEMRLESRVS